MWVSLSLAVLWWSERRWPVSREIAIGRATRMRSLLVPGALGAVGAGVAFALLAAHWHVTPCYVQAHASLVLGAIAIAAVASLMASAATVALSGTDPGPTAVPRRRLPPAPG